MMDAFVPLIGMLVIGIPLAWFVSEFKGPRWLRLVLGSLAIVLCFGIAAIVGTLERFNYNAWYGSASKKLIDATVSELESGNRDRVLRSLKDLQKKYAPTYEN